MRHLFVDLSKLEGRTEDDQFGDPLASIFGPVLLLLYINDISPFPPYIAFLCAVDTYVFLGQIPEELEWSGKRHLKHSPEWLITKK